MVETSYRIVQCKDGGFVIEVIRFGALPQTAAGFETEAAAQSWIAQDKRLWESAGPSQTSASRKWRGT
jgi:hypothetical protein